MSRDHPPPAQEVLRWAARRVHPRAVAREVVPLLGGITAHMDHVRVDSPAGTTDVVLRRWPDEAWADGLVAQEAAALASAAGHTVPAPRLLAADPDGATTGVRCTLTTFLPGRPDLTPAALDPWLKQLATTQAAIHAVPAPQPTREDRPAPGSVPDRYAGRERPLTWVRDRGLRAAARQAAAGPRDEETVFVHGDYQHFNVLWSAGRLSGVVDWPSATAGSRGSDVGHCRLNLAVLFDAEVAADYLVAYERAAGVRVDRRADLRSLLCFDLEWQDFIPRQVDGRAPLDLAGMPDRVAGVVRRAVDELG